MRTLRALLCLATLLSFAACPEKKEQGAKTYQVQEHQTASEGLKEGLPTSEGNPMNSAVKNMGRLMQESDGRQQKRMDRAEEAATQE